MNKVEEERIREDMPKKEADDQRGARVLASFGGALTIAALIGLAVIVVIWWLIGR